jgi:hypothetical protein
MHKWKKSTEVIEDDRIDGGRHRSLVWRCKRCDLTVTRTRTGMNSIPPWEADLIVKGVHYKCDEIIVQKVMES